MNARLLMTEPASNPVSHPAIDGAEPRWPSLRWSSRAGLLLFALPALWTGLLILRYGVDVPFLDQWNGFCPLLEKAAAGTLGWRDFVAQHNEHRIPFPRLIMFGLARLSGWNPRAEMAVIWLLLCTCAINVFQMARLTRWTPSRNRDLLLFLASVLVFTPQQYENLLWGFQLGFVLPIACTTACFWVGLLPRPSTRFLGAILLCFISTFSVASGLGSWCLATPVLWVADHGQERRAGGRWWLLWAAAAATSVGLYARGYVKPTYHPSTLEWMRHPWAAIQYVLIYLGSAFSFGPHAFDIAQGAAATMVAIVLFGLGYVWRHRQNPTLIRQFVPWLMLSGLAFGSAAATAIGRMGFGVQQAFASRYVSFSLQFPVGAVFMTALVIAHWRANRPPGTRALIEVPVALSAIALAALHVTATVKSMDAWAGTYHDRLTTKAVVQTINIVDEPNAVAVYVHPDPVGLKERINLLNRLGYLRPGLLMSNHVRDIAAAAPGRSPAEIGRIAQVGMAGTALELSGWAFLPGRSRPADAVLLTYTDRTNDPVIFGLATVDHGAAWHTTFDTKKLPESVQTLDAWAYDAQTARAYRMARPSPTPQ